MPSARALQLSPIAAGRAPTPQQKRFNTLVRNIEKLRLSLGAWQESLPKYQQAYAAEVLPLHGALAAVRREWAIRLDALSDSPGFSRAENALLSRLVCQIVGELLQEEYGDAEARAGLRALFARHAGIDFDTAQQRQLQATLEMMREVTGVDMGDAADIKSEDDLAERLNQKMRAERAAQQAADEARQAAKASRRRKSPAQQKREMEEKQATQSLRDIFRKLASALHPDREADPQRRQAKTALMQKANQAYAANDLLALLQLQLEIEQVDAAHIAGAGEEKLRHYNKVLAEQVEQLKEEIFRLEAGFRIDTGLPPDLPVNPGKLGELIKQTKRALREEHAQLRQELRMLADPAAARRWLKQYRRAA